ncbi:hypothetical protein A2U01_0057275, partial [Trifolium medium]|nr:hypothetical protein [Trifolium medium]
MESVYVGGGEVGGAGGGYSISSFEKIRPVVVKHLLSSR